MESFPKYFSTPVCSFTTRNLCDWLIPIMRERSAVGAAVANYGIRPTLQTARAQSLPYDNDFFDCVVVISTLEMVADLEQVCREIDRVLMAEGRLIVVTEGLGLRWNQHEPVHPASGQSWRRTRRDPGSAPVAMRRRHAQCTQVTPRWQPRSSRFSKVSPVPPGRELSRSLPPAVGCLRTACAETCLLPRCWNCPTVPSIV